MDLFQADIKLAGLPLKIVMEAVEQATGTNIGPRFRKPQCRKIFKKNLKIISKLCLEKDGFYQKVVFFHYCNLP